MTAENKKVLIVGAGLCGSLLGCYLVKRGYEVEMYEKRNDLRLTTEERGRSINLALSSRGIRALEGAGIGQILKNICIPMYNRAIHVPGSDIGLFPYSGRQGEYINSISRSQLNEVLLDSFDQSGGRHVHFRAACTNINFESHLAYFDELDKGTITQVKYDYLFGTDGAASAVRHALYKRPIMSYSYQQDFLNYGYKELILPAGSGNSFQIEKNALHIWPRGHFMMIALPNLDGSFTVTLFLPLHGSDSFDEIDSNIGIEAYFEKYFKDIQPLFDDLEEQYAVNPIGMLGTIKCQPWTDGKNAIILGDAAHAIVPFYGQGMNAAFEDVRVLGDLLDDCGQMDDAFFNRLQSERRINTDAIADLAIDNFYEMRDRTGDLIFQAKRRLETRLEKNFPDYYSKYSLVTFRNDVPYHEAMVTGRKQDEWLMDYCAMHPEPGDSELKDIYNLLKAEII